MELDKHKLRRAFDRAAGTYDAAAVLQREVADRMRERLDLVRMTPQVILDVGSGTGYCLRALARRYRRARLLGIDISPSMVRRAISKQGWFTRPRFACGDAECLPIAGDSIDLLVSNLTLQWCDPVAAFNEFFRVLRPGGLLMFTTFGPDTLRELRAAWAGIDDAPHVHDFIDMHDLGDAMVNARFADPVMDMEQLTLTYDDVPAVLRDLKFIGANNAAVGRAPGLTGKDRFARFKRAYEARDRAGRIPATYEIVYGHAWIPEAKPRRDGAVAVPVGAIGRRR